MASAYILVLLLGLAVGSFLNVVVYRVLSGDSPFRGRSECTKCKNQISWKDNIPLVSFFLLRGKCRKCKALISWHYPVLEFLTGVLFVWWFVVGRFFFTLSQGPFDWVQPGFWLIVGVVFVSLVVADLFYGVLPDIFTIGLTVIAFVYRFALTMSGIMQLNDFLWAIAAGILAGGFYLSLVLVTRGKGMGGGDVKLALALGIVLGVPKILVANLAAFLTGAGVGIILIVGKQKKFGQTIPFGPFMIFGAVMALLWGEQIWRGYINLLGL